jgi:hypothetical protein
VASAERREHPINLHRKLGVDELSARYRKIKYGSSDDYITDWHDFEQHFEPDWSSEEWSGDDRTKHPSAILNRMWIDLITRLQDAGQFNPLPLTLPSTSKPLTDAPLLEDPRTIEAQLLGWLDVLHQQPLSALLPSQADLAALQALSSRYWQGDLRLAGLLVLFSPFWCRSPRTFQPPQRGARTAALVRHLFQQWPIPSFLLNAWREPPQWVNLRWLMLSVLLGRGGSLRRLTRTKHFTGGWHGGFRPAPSKLQLTGIPGTLPPLQGLMLAEIHRLGGDQRELCRLCRDHSYVIDPLSHNTTSDALRFWQGTIQWLVAHRDDLTGAEPGGVPLAADAPLGWARHRFTEMLRGGSPFSWSGRTWASIERESTEYHRQLQTRGRVQRSWPRKGWDWSWEDWTVEELCTTEALRQESLAMRHCVRLYDWKCHRGHAAIFRVSNQSRPVLTVEVQPNEGRIVQVRGVFNRTPTASEKGLLTRWHRTMVSPPQPEA